MSINAWGSDDPAEVAKGGTGASTLTDGGVLLGSGTAAVTVTSQPTDGQLLIGNTGSDPSLAAPTGDANEIAITTGAGSLAVGLADNLVMPGTSAYTWVDGTTAQEPAGSAGQARYDTDTNLFMGYNGSSWQPFAFGGGSGKILQFSQAVFTGTSNITTIIPYDDTIPQNTEGGAVMDATITPVSSSSTLWVTALVVGGSSQGTTVAALFRDSGADAVATTAQWATAGTYRQDIVSYTTTSGSTSSTTFYVRAGPIVSGSFYVNSDNTGRLFGGTSMCTITILEVAGP